MTNFFITGTDTGVGKTIISAVFTALLGAYYWKPVESGLADGDSDVTTVKHLTAFNEKYFLPSCYQLAASLSPHQAAALENININLDQIKKPDVSPLVVEGAGGVYVPLNQDQSMLDLMQQLNLPVIVVARGTLGTINHTLLTLESLRQRGLTIKGVVFNGELHPPNQTTIEAWGQVKTLFHFPHQRNLTPQLLNTWVDKHRAEILSRLLCQ